MLRRIAPLVLAFSVFSLVGCDTDPTPDLSMKKDTAGSRFAVVKAGEPLEVDGCSVQVHRVFTSGRSPLPPFTLATAKCPTSQVTATSASCGKNCVSDVVQVQAVKVDNELTNLLADSPEKVEEAKRLAAARALASSELVEAQAQARLAAAKRRVLELDAGTVP